MSDEELEAADVARIGDTLANRDEYQEADEWIGSVINQLETTRSYSVREFLHLMGRELAEIAHEDGIMTAAYKSRIPVFCPDIAGTELSVGIARAKFEKKLQLTFDTTQDTMEMMQIAQKTRNSGIITLGSINAQNMVNIGEVSSYITRTTARGLQICDLDHDRFRSAGNAYTIVRRHTPRSFRQTPSRSHDRLRPQVTHRSHCR
ncbi:MAG: deoxyhypusine synthase family protein [Chloracidobacterium sp.]|nr:deoxyhypusine synthase family protein [Chloracidobacterium sp.]